MWWFLGPTMPLWQGLESAPSPPCPKKGGRCTQDKAVKALGAHGTAAHGPWGQGATIGFSAP